MAYEHPSVRREGAWRPGQASPVPPFRHVLVSDRAGDTLTLAFKGSEIGLIDVAAPDGAALTYAVDGAPFQTLAPPPGAAAPAMRPVALARGLDRNAEHTLVLKTASPGIARIGGFLLNGTVQDAFAGLTALQRIDAIYAAMDPLAYTPPPERFAHLPKTLAALRGGGTLRMVLLGDSIMGNTSSSAFELLLTPVFGAMRDEHIKSFTREIDTATGNFRHNLMKVATEERCAFFDMTGPWWSRARDRPVQHLKF